MLQLQVGWRLIGRMLVRQTSLPTSVVRLWGTTYTAKWLSNLLTPSSSVVRYAAERLT
jgi:hypothetical protein